MSSPECMPSGPHQINSAFQQLKFWHYPLDSLFDSILEPIWPISTMEHISSWADPQQSLSFGQGHSQACSRSTISSPRTLSSPQTKCSEESTTAECPRRLVPEQISISMAIGVFAVPLPTTYVLWNPNLYEGRGVQNERDNHGNINNVIDSTSVR